MKVIFERFHRLRAAWCPWLAAIVIILILHFVPCACAQSYEGERPVPILTGNAGYFTYVNHGQTELVPEVNPVLLLPLGNKWLVESRAGFEGDFERENGSGPYKGVVSKGIDYLQVDYIANPFVTVSAGRFLTPFGIYNERLYPIWIRSLQTVPLIYGLSQESSDGLMLRGGFSLSRNVNMNYASYFSTLSTVHKFESDRLTGGRLGFFFPKRRIEVGGSFQKLLQEGRGQSFGFHAAWQPLAVPLNLRSEYARADLGSGYWVESAYRLSQVPVLQRAMRQTEVVVRAQQFFVGRPDPEAQAEYGLPRGDVQQADLGLNYFLRDGLKASASFGRWWGRRDYNIWTVGMAYRFAIPLGRVR